jgi:hypothetical protein
MEWTNYATSGEDDSLDYQFRRVEAFGKKDLV